MKNLRTCLKWCASLKITVVCLLLFMVITLLGTFYQVEHDINEARKVYFTSWYVLINGMFPFPGGQTVIWVFFVNLLAACFTRFGFSIKKSGIWLTHLGLIGLCFSSFYTYKFSTEGMVTILEGETAAFADVDGDWEFSVWTEKDGQRHVTGFFLNESKHGQSLSQATPGLTITLNTFYPAAQAYQDFSPIENRPLNLSKIIRLEAIDKSNRTAPGAEFTLSQNGKDDIVMMLYGLEMYPTSYEVDGVTYYFQLRRQRLKLPVELTLDDVIQEKYTHTEVAKRYESKVTITTDSGETRKTRIYMNHPLTVEDFTIYQSGYSKDQMSGKERTSLSVVKNAGKYYPYIACVVVSVGMVVHLLIVFVLFVGRLFKRSRETV